MTAPPADAGARAASPSASEGLARATSLPALLAARADATPDAAAFVERDAHARWITVTWREHAARVERLARAFATTGIRPGDRVGLLAATSVRWDLAQAALLASGAVVVGIDPNYPDDTCRRVLGRTGLRAIVPGDRAVVERLTRLAGSPPVLAVLDPAGAPGLPTVDGLIERTGEGTPLPPPAPESAAIVVFSSGTTGDPKGIAYSHAQVLLAARALVRAFPDVDGDARLVCWLPLANLFQRILNVCAVTTGSASWVIADPRDVMIALAAARPHLFIGVPKFFERVHAQMDLRIAALPRWRRALVERALAAGAARATSGDARAMGVRVAASLADVLVLRRLRAAFGGAVRHLISGSAPLPEHVAHRFASLGLPIHEAYGVSECIVPLALSRPGATRAGTVGKPLPEGAVRLAADGEILVGGPGRFAGYLDGPTVSDWWPTGDLGAFDADGFLRVTGRRSEAFKTSTGRWVQPQAVEGRLAAIPAVEHAAVFGRARAGVVALLALGERPAGTDDPRALAAAVAQATASLPRHARPVGVVVTRERLSIARGDMTANLKLRRQSIEARFAEALDEVSARAARRDRPDAGPVVLLR
jgi:long-chain acyl-CoA synthetase